MHQTVREFLLRPRRSLINSHFQINVMEKPARRMIATTCIQYLGLHYRELENRFQNVVGASASSWSSKDIVGLVRYLNGRPFIRYSLEYLTMLKEDESIDPDVRKLLTVLTTNIQSHPSCLQVCFLGRLTNFSADSERVQKLNHQL